jgi:hypothetical protein
MNDEANKQPSDEPTQITPKGLEIPVPKYKDLVDSFRKIVGAPTKKHP